MMELGIEPSLLAPCVLGGGSAALGLLVLFLGPAARRGSFTRLVLGLVVLLLIVTVVLVHQGLPYDVWLAPATLAAVCLLWITLGSDHFAQVAASLRRPRVQGLVLVLAGPVLAFWLAGHAVLRTRLHAEEAMTLTVPALEEVQVVQARTDWGRPVRLFAVSEGAWPTPAMLASERYLLHVKDISPRALRTAPIEPRYNCHGWVFTEGQYFVADEDVEAILQDNGYRRVLDPQARDVVIYFDEDGAIVHSGLVRLAEERLVLVESKWGLLGRYLHNPDAQPYGASWSYYRSLRQGHRLAGVPGSTPAGMSPVPTVRRDI